MEQFVVNNRYEIRERLAIIGNIFLFQAHDALKERDVLFSLTVFPYLERRESWYSLRTYYENLILWLHSMSDQLLAPIVDFGEVSVPIVSRWPEMATNVDFDIQAAKYACYFVSDKMPDYEFLAELDASPDDILSYAFPVLSALSRLHEQGIIYYHLSPFTILCNKNVRQQVALLNVGIVPPGHVHFIPSRHSAPEIGNPWHDCRADIYSFASTFLHVLTRSLPEKVDSNHIKEQLGQIGLGPQIAEVFSKCMQLSPDHRFADVEAVARQLGVGMKQKPSLAIMPRRYILRQRQEPSLPESIQAIDQLVAGKPPVYPGFFFYGKPGVGKTAVLRQLDLHCQKAGIKTLWPGAKIHPLLELPSFSAMAKGDAEFSAMASANLHFPFTGYISLADSCLQMQRQLFKQLEYRSATTPLVVLLDDLQLAGKEDLDIIKYLLVHSALASPDSPGRFLIIGAGTISEEPAEFDRFLQNIGEHSLLKSKVIVESLTNSALQAHNFIAAALGMASVPEKFASYLSDLAKNNASFIHRALSILIQRGTLYRESQEWCMATRSLQEIELPTSLVELIGRQVEQICGQDYQFLLPLAAGYRSLELDILFDCWPPVSQPLVPLLWKCYRQGIINIDSDFTISLASGQLGEYLREALQADTTKMLHLASVLKNRAPENGVCFILANLYCHCRQMAEALPYLREVVDHLTAWGAEDRLEAWLERYLRLLDDEDQEQVAYIAELAFFLQRYTIATCYFDKLAKNGKNALPLLCQAELALHEENLDSAKEYLKQAKPLVEKSASYNVYYYLLKAWLKYLQQDVDQAINLGEQALELASQLFQQPENREKALLAYYRVLTSDFFCQRIKSPEAIEAGLEMAQNINCQQAQLQLSYLLACCHQWWGNYRQALENFQKSLEFAEQLCYPLTHARALIGITNTYLSIGCYDKAEVFLKQATDTCKRHGLKQLKAQIYSLRSQLALVQGNLSKAIALTEDVVALFRKAKDGASSAMALARLADLLIKKEDSKAISRWRQASELAKQLNFPRLQVYIDLVKSRLLHYQDEQPEKALPSLTKAAKIAKEYHFQEYLWQIYYQQGNCYRAVGNIQLALECFRQAQSVIEAIMENFSPELSHNYLSMPEIKLLSNVLANLTGELPLNKKKIVDDIYLAGQFNSDVDKFSPLEQIVQDYEEEVESINLNVQREEIANLRKLLEINKKLNSEHNLRKLLDFIMDIAIEITRAERGFLILTETRDKKAFEVARNFEREDIAHPEFEISHSITEKVIRTGLPILATDAIQDDRFDGYRSVSELNLHSVLAVPLCVKERVIGAVYIDNRFEKAVFSEKEKQLLEAFSDQAALAIENTRLLNENLHKQQELIRSKEQIEKLNQELAGANAKLAQKIERREEELKEVKDILHRNRRELHTKYQYNNIIGKSKPMQDVFRIMDKVADKNIPVFIYGASGTGKELVARAIHFNSDRKEQNFLSENCAAFSETLLASELFGHVKGAFTGAYTDKKGLFELADGGTLFLDEVGDMSQSMQANLLRVLEANVIRRVGGKDEIQVNVRIVSASNKNLHELVEEKQFREDLFFRLKVVQINLPLLRERKEDVQLLVEHFLKEHAEENKGPVRSIDKKALQILMNCDWPGNIRQLRNVLYNALSLNDEMELTARHFNDLAIVPSLKVSDFFSQELSIDEYARLFVQKNQDRYNDSQLARILGFSRKTLWEKRKKWELYRN